MPRIVASGLTDILANGYRRDALEIYLADGTIRRLSRGAVTRSGNVYANSIQSVGEIKNSIGSPVNRLEIKCQNIDSTLGGDVASSLRKLTYAFARYTRDYVSHRGVDSVTEADPFFGVVSGVTATEKDISYEIVSDLESIGKVLASRTFSPRCPWVYKNGIECTSTSGLGACPKDLTSCIARGKPWEHGGWEFFENPVSEPPGPDINPPGGGGDCFIQDTLINTENGYVPIDRIEVGQRVMAFDELTGIILPQKVIGTTKTKYTGPMTTFEFYATGFPITMKPTHRIFTGTEMRIADNWEINDLAHYIPPTGKIPSTLGSRTKLRSIGVGQVSDIYVYNLQVEHFATYFAGGIAVSNSKPITLS